ncbi:MAG: flippase-like domain-containing protein [Bacteroidales bacterium]|nr:flippase-like domain-containing protein [Bacteroidales bacterium]
MAVKKFNWFTILRLAGVALFIVVLARTDLGELWSWIRTVDGTSLFLAILFQLLVLLIKAWRWYNLNEAGFDAHRLGRRSGEFFEGYAMGVITPGRMGELMKAGHAGTRTGILGTGLRVIAERGMDLSIFIVVAGIAMSQGALPGVSNLWGWLVLAAGILGMSLSLIILISPGMVLFAEYTMKMVRMLPKDKTLEFVSRTPWNSAGFVAWSLMSNLSFFVCCYFLAAGVGIGLDIIHVSGGVAVAGVLNSIPVTVMGLGTREVTFLYVFSAFPRAQVMAFSGLVFLVAQIGGGIISLVMGQILLFKYKANQVQ